MKIANEIRPGFSFKYILLVFVTAIISATAGYLIPNFFKKKANRTITVRQLQGENFISDSLINNNLFDVKYSLKNDSTPINGYYRKTVILTNAGNEGVEDLPVNIKVVDSAIQFVSEPRIETSPKEIINAMKISSKNENIRSANIQIPLLNAGESVILNFEAYSKIKKNKLDVEISIRKKDWIMKTENAFIINENNDSNRSFEMVIAGLLGTTFLGIILSFILTYRKWKRNPKLKELFISYWDYYNYLSAKEDLRKKRLLAKFEEISKKMDDEMNKAPE